MWRGGLGAAYLFPPLSSGSASIASPCSVSTSRSSNRTCGFPASGAPTAVAFRHTLPALSRPLHLKAKLVPGSPGLSLEVIGLRHSPDLCSLPKRVRSQAPSLPACRARHGAGRHRHYPASQVLRACPPPHTQPGPRGLPVCVRRTGRPSRVGASLSACVHAQAGALLPSPTTAAFPEIQAGRLPHCPFRDLPTTKSLVGLLSVHSRYGLHTRQVALRPSTPEALAISSPTSPLRLLPTCLPSFRPVCRTGRRRQAGATLVGWDSHPLEIRAFSRRTE